MKIEDVPQEDADAFEVEIKVLQYAVDQDGNFTTVKSVGWNPKTVVMKNAWDFVHERAAQARQKVLEGKRSPLYYHAVKNMMNASLLAAYAGFSRFSVYRHFYPKAFNRLSREKLHTYAGVFGYKTVDEIFLMDQDHGD